MRVFILNVNGSRGLRDWYKSIDDKIDRENAQKVPADQQN
jgi:hypothetical protein